MYHPNSGGVKFNNISGKEIDLIALRNRVGLVAQETQLFAGTIRENLLFVKPTATDEECIMALTSASANTLIDRGDKGGQ